MILAYATILTLLDAPQALGSMLQFNFSPEPVEAPADPTDGLDDIVWREGVDVVITLEGDRLFGKVDGIAKDGVLRLRGPQFEGEANILVSGIEQVRFGQDVAEAEEDRLLLANGDYVACSVVSVLPSAVIVDSEVFGRLEFPRSAVRQVDFSTGVNTLINSRFEEGAIEPWTAHRGSWSVANGTLICPGGQSPHEVYAPLEQDGPVTFEGEFEFAYRSGRRQRRRRRGNGFFTLCVFADSYEKYFGGNGVYSYVHRDELLFGRGNDGSQVLTGKRTLNSTMDKGTLRLGYDPVTGSASMWVNGKFHGKFNVDGDLKRGKYVVVYSEYPVIIRDLRVFQGVVPPPIENDFAENDKPMMVFKNGDRLSVEEFGMTKSVVTVDTGYGELSMSKSRVACMQFKPDVEAIEHDAKSNATIHTGSSSVTFELEELTDEYIIGNTALLGRIKVSRSMLESIDFTVADK